MGNMVAAGLLRRPKGKLGIFDDARDHSGLGRAECSDAPKAVAAVAERTHCASPSLRGAAHGEIEQAARRSARINIEGEVVVLPSRAVAIA